MATTKDPQVQEQSHLIRSVIANLNISFPEADELKFRTSILLCVQECLGNLSAAQITRLYEAACEVKFASDDVKAFRSNVQLVIAKNLNLARFKAARKAAAKTV